MEFMSLSRRRSSSRNFPSGEDGGGTAVFVGYYGPLTRENDLRDRIPHT